MNQGPQSVDQRKELSASQEAIRESVSALMDGEAQELELRRLLSSDNLEAVNDSWQRYHLARDALKGNLRALNLRQLDISRQVSALVASEAVPVVNGRVWLKPVAGFTVAASVTMAVIFGVQGVNQPLPGAVNSFENSPVEGAAVYASNRVYPVVGSSLQASAGTGSQTMVNYRNTQLPSFAVNPASADLEAQQRLDKYLLRHTENAALNNGQGIISFARVASFESE